MKAANNKKQEVNTYEVGRNLNKDKAAIDSQAPVTLVGLILLALGTTLCLLGNVGVDPFTAMTIAVSTHFGLGLGSFQLGINCVFIIAVLLWQRASLGMGTVFNMVCVGYMVQFMRAWLKPLIPTNGGWLQSAVLLIVGIFVMTLGVGRYFSTDLGMHLMTA